LGFVSSHGDGRREKIKLYSPVADGLIKATCAAGVHCYNAQAKTPARKCWLSTEQDWRGFWERVRAFLLFKSKTLAHCALIRPFPSRESENNRLLEILTPKRPHQFEACNSFFNPFQLIPCRFIIFLNASLDSGALPG
jgi:hypothetical protein